MAFQQFETFDQAKEAGIEYMLTVGRRQPMHIGHLATINKIMDNGVKPIIVIGSTNTATKQNGLTDPFFEPAANPLTAEQQREQIKIALAGKTEGVDYHVVEFPDLGNNDKWCAELADILKGRIEIDGKFPDLSAKTAFHFFGKEIDKRPRRLVTGDGEEKEVLAYFWEGIFEKLGLPVLLDKAHEGIDANLSASSLRGLDLNKLTPEEKALFAAPDYIIGLAREARAKNGLPGNIPVTLADVSLVKLMDGKQLSRDEVLIDSATKQGINLDDVVAAIKKTNGSIKAEETVRIKVATASLNQTVYDFATNVANIKAAIDKAVEDGADFLALQELGLTGYAADDYHQWNKNNDAVWRQLQHVAEYAKSKNPNLIISIGTPWHYADKNLPADHPLYNLNNRPYNTQVTITDGKVVAIAAKSILADGPAEYEPRQFNKWPVEQGTIDVTLPDGSTVPFGKPVVRFGKEGQEEISFFTEQCAEGWPGVNDDLTINVREQNQARLIAELSKTTDLSLVINPSASRPQPAINKEEIRSQGLCKSGSKFCGAFVYVNYLGSESGIYAAEGSQIYAQDGNIIHHGQRYNFADVSYSSATIDVPLAKRGKAHATAQHNFTAHKTATIGGDANFEAAKGDELVYEEYARSISLWLRDYLAKQSWPAQGYLISLSGGADSAYGAIAIAQMIELDVKAEGVEGFFERFPHLKCKDEALRIYGREGQNAAIDHIKRNMLTCVYLPTENSSETTLNAARVLIEGGELPNGRKIRGIGGKFEVHNVQGALDEYLLSHAGLDMQKAIVDAEKDKSRGVIAHAASWLVKQVSKISAFEGLYEGWMQLVVKYEIRKYVNADATSNPKLPAYIADNCTRNIPTWSSAGDDITLQNYQARARLVIPWAIANQEGKIALVTSNASESAIGYTTAGGDMHMGGANPIGGLPKSTLKASLKYLQEHGLIGLEAIEALHYITVQKPSAELRKAVEGAAPQTDENDLGFSYGQSEEMERTAITGRRTPQEAFDMLKGKNSFPSDPAELRGILVRFLDKRWAPSQFKRVMGTLAPYVGDNFDPHASVRTTVLGDHFKTGLAHLTLHIISKKLGGADNFAEQLGVPLDEVKGIVERSRGLKQQLIQVDCSLLSENNLGSTWFGKELRREYQQIEQMRTGGKAA